MNGDVLEFKGLFPEKQLELVLRVKRANPHRKLVLILLSGRPLPLSKELLAHVDAVVAAWLPGTEGTGVADVLSGEYVPSGKLSVRWPSESGTGYLYPRGHGLTTW
eukprot:gnl/TRDRNA2_/TRDRNA2_155882_c0_seq2.p1 gnl/TRDRNA2_/TRDRNA2_155882_c0~~gnl/TRDRNA2_/TRDRNA2_155882_c0_seq2.p1  ORF type:complete len:106 (+),score=11.45 gnl/TRDRNA2_/TRDRNA2_155882_c0_seq2:159-476(+)